ncbi:MAG: alkaline phosphatase [Pontiellaceae bacterium]|nr:alkaline phosphatase [Pontiellaceae bacterium]
MFKVKARFYLVPLAAALIVSGCVHNQIDQTPPKYVFFFLGDGMSSPQIEAAQAFKAEKVNSAESLLSARAQLNMTQMPVVGLSTTFCDNRFVADSAACATAFATGQKTQPGVIGLTPSRDTSVKSIAELAQEKGMAIGIISSAPLSHATPAAYYANVDNRDHYCDISYQASLSGFDFFGGGRFENFNDTNNTARITPRQAFEDAGYTTLTNRSEILRLKNRKAGKVICSVETSHDGKSMPNAIDTPPENFTLAEITQVAINYLQSNPEGFFIEVEGGKIDWTCHDNDIVTTIHEVLAFDEAVGVALDFMKRHPDETLIVVTGDHETGGLTLGSGSSHYNTELKPLHGQTKSGGLFNSRDLEEYKKTHEWTSVEESNIDDEMKGLIKENFGLDWEALTEYQRDLLEKAFDASLGEAVADDRISGYSLGDDDDNVDYLSYGGKEPLTISITRMVARESGWDWTTTAHTALPCPVFAGGKGATDFTGFYDNTDIAKKISRQMGLPVLPVVDPDKTGRPEY